MDNPWSMLENLPIFALLPQEVKKVVINSFVPVSFSFGNVIVQEGKPADAFYVLASGRARVIKTDSSGQEISLSLLRPGDTFGEMGLLSQTEKKRMATVRASSDVLAFRLDSSIFQAIVQTNPEIKEFFALQIRYRNLHNFFLEYTPFCCLQLSGLKTLLSETQEIAVEEGEMIIRQGNEPGPMYIIEDGRLRVFTEEHGERVYRAYLRKGDFFGELSMLKGIKRSASVQAITPCTLLMLERESFSMMVENYPEFIAQIEDRISQYDYHHAGNVPLDFDRELVTHGIKDQKGITPSLYEHEDDYSGTTVSSKMGPFASPEGLFVKKRRKRIRNFPYIWQRDEMDCGAASLAMVCRYFGNQASLSHIRQLVFTGIEGASLKAICHAAQELGLEARSVKVSRRNLVEMPLPAIVHWEGNHWVVLYDMDKKWVHIADPAVGLRWTSRDEFEKKWTGYAALFDCSQHFDSKPEGKTVLDWLWTFIRPCKQMMLKVLFLTLGIGVVQLTLPILAQITVDMMLEGRTVGLLSLFAFSMLTVLCIMAIVTAIHRYLLSMLAVHIDISAMDSLTQRILAFPMTFFTMRHKEELREHLTDIQPLLDSLTENGVNVLTGMIQLVLAIILMLFYSPLMGLLFLATLPLYILIVRFSSQQLRLSFNMRDEFFTKNHAWQLDILKGIEAVKSVGAEGALRKGMLNQFQHIAQPLVNTRFYLMLYEALNHMISFFFLALFWWAGIHRVMNGRLGIGGLIAFSLLLVIANDSLSTLSSVWQNAQAAAGMSERVHDMIEQEPEQGADHSHLLPVRTLEGRIRMQNMGFRYGGPDSLQILRDITIEFPPGKRIAIVGRNGSGKTTLVKCIAGLLTPTEGTILYDNVDMNSINHKDLRRHFGLVLQENHIFNGTIAGNIALGEHDPDMDRVLWASRMSTAHLFIENLPLGYDTRVGETGVVFTPSQRQRIVIARAIYHQPSILILDNAFCTLDEDSATMLRENMSSLIKGRTCFIIENRLSDVKGADMIIVMEKGRIVEQGTHAELIMLRGIYYYLFGDKTKRKGWERQKVAPMPCS